MVLIFDMDGVIVDNHLWHFKAWVEFGKRHGMKITKSGFYKHFGSTNNEVFESIFGSELTDSEKLSFSIEKESIYRELYKSAIKPVIGIEKFLKSASGQGILIGLATSAPYENVKFTLEATCLYRYFNVITDSTMVIRGKPDPQVYLITAEKLGVAPRECIVFEDSIPGISAARNAGMRVIGVATTHKREELLMYVNEIIMNFDASDKTIKSLLNNPEKD